MSKLAKFLSQRIKISGIEEDVVEYIFFNLVSQAYYFIVCLLIGCMLKNITSALVFFFSFTLIRRYSGGVHASTEIRCTVLSTAVILISLIAAELIPFEIISLKLSLVAASFLLTVILSPVTAPEKPLSEKRKRINKYKASVVSAAELILVLVCRNDDISSAVLVAMTVEAVMLIAGAIKNNRLKIR